MFLGGTNGSERLIRVIPSFVADGGGDEPFRKSYKDLRGVCCLKSKRVQ